MPTTTCNGQESKIDVHSELPGHKKTDDQDNQSCDDAAPLGAASRIIVDDVAEHDVSEENQNNPGSQQTDPGVFIGALSIPGSNHYLHPSTNNDQIQQVVDAECGVP